MKKKKVVLVGCGKAKKKDGQPWPAREMYTSDRFKDERKYAECVGDEWFILSAKHKLLSPNRVIETYDKSLSEFSCQERRDWSKKVFDALMRHGFHPDEYEFIIFADENYCKCLLSMLKKKKFSVRAYAKIRECKKDGADS